MPRTTNTGHKRAFSGATRSPAALSAGLFGSLALLPLVMIQGAATRRRVPRLPPAQPPHHGLIAGGGAPLRLLVVGESPVAGIGIERGDDTVAAATARELGKLTGRPVAWRAAGLSGATVRKAIAELVPGMTPEPADLIVIAFGVNDTIGYRAPRAFAGDLAALVEAVRARVGNAPVVIAGVPSFASIPAFPWALRHILDWRAAALQAAAERLPERMPRLVVQRFSEPFTPDTFSRDGFHPSVRAHDLWGKMLAMLALPLLADAKQDTVPAAALSDAGPWPTRDGTIRLR
jgi:lysophospholipase L1-like esterase